MKRLNALFLDRSQSTSLQTQLVRKFKELIRSGTLQAGEALPSTRELAYNLKVSRNTVVFAYERLISEGYLESTERSGIFVAEAAAALQSSVKAVARPVSSKPTAVTKLSSGLSKGPKPFRPCQPDVSLFPLAMWNRLRARTLRAQDLRLLHYNSAATLGLRQLRQTLASYLRDSRGVRCEWWQIAITSGSQQVLYLLAQLLLKPKDTVFMEDPGYSGATRAWRSTDCHIRFFPVDDQGVSFPKFSSGVKLAYVTPSRQFPTGASLSLPRRLAIVQGAAESGTWVIEDDYDSEFRYVAPPVPSLQSLDNAQRIIYVGTFSKLLFPSLRLGYAVLPPSLVDDFTQLKSTADDHGPMIDQATLALFLDSGAFYSHIRRCRRHYVERQEAFLAAMRKTNFPFDFRYTDGGMNLTAFLPEGQDDGALAATLANAGLDVPALSSYADGHHVPGLVFGFTAFTPEVIRRGVDIVRGAIPHLADWH